MAFEGKRFPGDTPMTKEGLTQRAYEGMRDNARKIAYQTKLDKRVFREVITGLGTFAKDVHISPSR